MLNFLSISFSTINYHDIVSISYENIFHDVFNNVNFVIYMLMIFYKK
jgi:hypothetical protein